MGLEPMPPTLKVLCSTSLKLKPHIFDNLLHYTEFYCSSILIVLREYYLRIVVASYPRYGLSLLEVLHEVLL